VTSGLKQTFTKEERLCSRRVIRLLFSSGSTFYQKPFRVTWMQQRFEGNYPVRVMMSVPKYNFHRAVDRNLIRRRMKEAYRLNKQALYDHLRGNDFQLVVSISYTAKDIMAYDRIQAKIIILLQRLIDANEKVTG
jgi:ribonuclease P protein component